MDGVLGETDGAVSYGFYGVSHLVVVVMYRCVREYAFRSIEASAALEDNALVIMDALTTTAVYYVLRRGSIRPLNTEPALRARLH